MSRSIVPNLAEHEIWFLTGSQTMYGDEVLAQAPSAEGGMFRVPPVLGEAP